MAEDKKAADDPTIINQVPPYCSSKILSIDSFPPVHDHVPGITEAMNKIKAKTKLPIKAKTEMIELALGPKRLVITSIVKKDNQEKRKAESRPSQSTFISMDLFAKRFIPTTDIKKKATQILGTLFTRQSTSINKSFVFVNIFCIIFYFNYFINLYMDL